MSVAAPRGRAAGGVAPGGLPDGRGMNRPGATGAGVIHGPQFCPEQAVRAMLRLRQMLATEGKLAERSVRTSCLIPRAVNPNCP